MSRAPEAAVYSAYAARELFDQGALTDAELALHQLTSGGVELDRRTVVVATSLEARLAACAGRLTEAVELASSSAPSVSGPMTFACKATPTSTWL